MYPLLLTTTLGGRGHPPYFTDRKPRGRPWAGATCHPIERVLAGGGGGHRLLRTPQGMPKGVRVHAWTCPPVCKCACMCAYVGAGEAGGAPCPTPGSPDAGASHPGGRPVS